MEKGKIIIKRMIIGFMTVVMTFAGMNITPVQAAAKVELGKKINYSYRVTSSDGYSVWGSHTNYILADNETAFCVQPGVLLNENAEYTVSDYTHQDKMAMEHLVYAGWELSEKTDEDYLAVQFMIWELLGAKINETSFTGYAKKKAEIKAKTSLLFEKSPSFDQDTVSVDAGKSITLTDTNHVFSYYSLKQKSEGITVTKNKDSLTISASKTAVDQGEVIYQLVKKGYEGASILYSSKTSQNVVPFKVSDQRNMSLKITVNHYGNLKIAKQDEDGNMVADTSFVISTNKDMSDPIGTYTTGRDGTVLLDQLSCRTYYVKEVSVPDHLVLDPTVHEVIVEKNETALFTAVNKWKKGKVLLRKADKDSGKQLAGAVYGIYDAKTDEEIMRMTTLSKGYAVSENLRFGTYYVKEIKAPDGYLLDETRYPVTVEENDQKIEITGIDERVYGQISVVKRGKVLTDYAGGKFAYEERSIPGMCVQIIAGQNIVDPSQDGVILYAEGDVVDTITTDKDGTAVSRLLPLGHYQVKEIEAPDGFVLNDESYDVELAYEGENKAVVLKSITIKNEKQDIRIKVLKHCGGEKLNGGSFGLYASQDIVSADGKLLLKADDLIETQKAIEGEIIFTSDLPLGSYYVYELEAPQGYVRSKKKLQFDASYQGSEIKTVELEGTIENKPTDMVFAKVDASGENMVAGAALEVIDKETQKVVEQWVSSLEPHVIYGLTEGKTYIFREKTAPYGYCLGKDIEFVAESGARVAMKNAQILIDLVLVKTDAKSGEPIKAGDFAFALYEDAACTKLLQKVYSDAGNATISFDDLPYGTYYIKEIKAPKGYLLDGKARKIEINEENSKEGICRITFENQPFVETGMSNPVLPFIVLTTISGYILLILLKKKQSR